MRVVTGAYDAVWAEADVEATHDVRMRPGAGLGLAANGELLLVDGAGPFPTIGGGVRRVEALAGVRAAASRRWGRGSAGPGGGSGRWYGCRRLGWRGGLAAGCEALGMEAVEQRGLGKLGCGRTGAVEKDDVAARRVRAAVVEVHKESVTSFIANHLQVQLRQHPA